MKNKGFTLAELLIVSVFMGIILLISVPNITSLMKQANDNKYESFLNDVYLATEAYIQKNISKYPELETGGSAYVYLSDIVSSHYLKSTTIDPKTNKTISEELNYTVIVTKNDDSLYQYELVNRRL